jgi:hypothetical protein
MKMVKFQAAMKSQSLKTQTNCLQQKVLRQHV